MHSQIDERKIKLPQKEKETSTYTLHEANEIFSYLNETEKTNVIRVIDDRLKPPEMILKSVQIRSGDEGTTDLILQKTKYM